MEHRTSTKCLSLKEATAGRKWNRLNMAKIASQGKSQNYFKTNFKISSCDWDAAQRKALGLVTSTKMINSI